MARVILNSAFLGLHGRMGDVVFRTRNGRTFASKVPRQGPRRRPTSGQREVRERFKLAAAYARAVLRLPETRASYERMARLQNRTVFATAMADYLHPPTVAAIETSGYRGRYGDTLAVLAHDDTEVVSVDIVLRLPCGTVLEHGPAERLGAAWQYTATTDAPAGVALTIGAVARDRPGNEGRATAVWQ